MKIDLRSLSTPSQTAVIVGLFALVLTGCGTSPATESTAAEPTQAAGSEPTSDEDSSTESDEVALQDETCDWDSPRISGTVEPPAGQDGELAEVLVGAWQHTHIDDGDGFEESVNDYRFVFPSSNRLLYCQHVPGATDHADNAGDIVLNGTTIELPGGKYSYTVTAWDEDTMVWDNPVGGGSVYLLQRR